MAAEQLPDLDELAVELEALERKEREVSAFRRKLHERIDNGFPTEFTLRQERQVSNERRELHRRIDELRAYLRPFGLLVDDAPPPEPRLGA